jgi:hypothetical protein
MVSTEKEEVRKHELNGKEVEGGGGEGALRSRASEMSIRNA